MPGIVGVVDSTGAGSSSAQAELSRIVDGMVSAMRYDSQYSVEVVSSVALGVCTALVGRSDQHRTTDAVTRDASVAVLMAGEASVENLAPCQSHEGVFIGRSAAEIAHLLRTRGVKGLGEVGGGFSGVLLDAQDSSCLIFNDWFGMERIFFHVDGDRFLFSSEAKAILAVAPRTRSFDPDGLGELLGCGGTLGTKTLYRDIEVLPAGTSVRLSPSRAPVKQTYFAATSLEALPAKDGESFLRSFPDVFAAAVNRAVTTSPAVGVSLTGGLDSRMVMAALPISTRVPCYTFGSMYRETKDVQVARAVAGRLGHPFEEITLDRQFVSTLPDTLDQAARISDGYIGLSGAAELYLNREARRLASVRVTGNWGGELLRGVRAFKFARPKGDFLHPDLARSIDRGAALFAGASDSFRNPLSYSLFMQMPVQGFGRYAVERSQMLMRSPFLAAPVLRALYAAPPALRASHRCSVAVIGIRPELLTIPTDMGLLGTTSAPVQFARQWQRKAMVKAEYLVSHGAPNWIAALTGSAAGSQVERLVLGRNKFQHFRRWLRLDLAEYVRDTLLHNGESNLDTWFDVKRLSVMVDDHVSGRGNYTEEIDKLLTIASIQRQLLRSPQITGARQAVSMGRARS